MNSERSKPGRTEDRHRVVAEDDSGVVGELTELQPARQKLIGAQLKLTDECREAIWEAKRSRRPVVLEHRADGTFIDVSSADGSKKRFECAVQKLADQAVVDVIALGRRSGEYKRLMTLGSKFQVKATELTFTDTTKKAKRLLDNQHKSQTIEGVHARGQKRIAPVLSAASSSKTKKLLLNATATDTGKGASSSSSAANAPGKVSEKTTFQFSSSSSLHGSRNKGKKTAPTPSEAVKSPKRVALQGSAASKVENRQRLSSRNPSPPPSSSSSSITVGGVATKLTAPKESAKRVSAVEERRDVGRRVEERPRKGPRTPPTPQPSPRRRQATPPTTFSRAPSRSPRKESTRQSNAKQPSSPPATTSISAADDERHLARGKKEREVEALPQGGGLLDFHADDDRGHLSLSSLSTSPMSSPQTHGSEFDHLASPAMMSPRSSARTAMSPREQNQHGSTLAPADISSAVIRGGDGAGGENGHVDLLNKAIPRGEEDWLSQLSPINSIDMAEEYRRMYKTDYEEYLKLYKKLDRVASQFRKLKDECESNGFSDEHSIQTVRKVKALYDKYRYDEEIYSMRLRHSKLHEKLVALKQRVSDWEVPRQSNEVP